MFDDDPFTVAGFVRFVPLDGATLTTFHDLEVQWLPGGVRWLVNGKVVRDESMRIPDEPMSVRLNFWAPDGDFADAFDATLRPARSASENRTFLYEVDAVEIRRNQPVLSASKER